MQSDSRFKLGLFVCLSIVLFIAVMIFLGALDRFQAKGYLVTFVAESVQGLTPGSEVKYQGVPIGTVKDITLEMESRLIRIDMEINLSKIRIPEAGEPGKFIAISREVFYQRLKESVEKKGLRCSLAAAGITGMKYVELEYVKASRAAEKFPVPDLKQEGDVFYIPSVPSLFSDLRSSVTNILAKLEALDYQGLMRKAEQTLAHADTLLTNPRINSILGNLEKSSRTLEDTMSNLRKTLTPEKIQELLRHSNATMAAVRQLSEVVEKELKEAEIKQLSDKSQLTLDSIRNTSTQFQDTMSRIDSAVDALIELIQMLDNDPSSLIHGKKRGPAMPVLSE